MQSRTKCDGKVPSCTRCLDARVDCVGFDSSTQREAPRSIADALEKHIAALERPNPTSPFASRPRISNVAPAALSPVASHSSDSHSWTGDRCTYTDGLVNVVMEDITPTFLGVSKMKPILSCVVKGTQIPSKKGPIGATDLDENHPRSIINPQPLKTGLDAIDYKTAVGLFKNFLDRVITQYPIYHRSDAIAAFNSIYHPVTNPNQDSPRNRYIISIIMAISLSTAARTNQMAANSTAYTLVRHAMQWIPEVATNDLSGLQAILLLTQYTFLNPSVADLWLLTGLISQAVVDQGLHQELPNDIQITAFQRDMRRRLFWIAWEMEVAVCCIFLRPINLPTRNINVAYPLEVDDMHITEKGIDFMGRLSKFNSKRIWAFRQLEAEIISVLHHDEPIPKEHANLDAFVQHHETSILEWRQEVYRTGAANQDPKFGGRWKEMQLYSDIAYPYIIVALHRPSKRIPQPTTDNLMKVFECSVQIADGYWRQSNQEFGIIKYVFHPLHHCFSAAIEFLRALQRCKAEVSERFSYDQVQESMAVFSRFFATIAERWPAAARCLDEYERLLAPMKKEYLDFLVQKSSNAPKTAISIGEVAPDLYNYQTTLDDAFNYWTAFNPATTADATDTLGAFYSFPVGHDWNTEFNLNFGMDVIPEV
ncbi:hypothetical protein EJ04DRAFT_172562 [Polyplosphaeria fusca]|uniref:Xylanolytic transcriptional activator regulatory domain-containing protein n=1 Tax=Polyplosphaeria fusca TaxID=682080 RepID=A0A9P4V4H5_9PLEO|nr:hypothetical protein EJ04DRAFT_172562 [Polyplosphaeria fusca]